MIGDKQPGKNKTGAARGEAADELEEYGVWVKIEPQDFSAPLPEPFEPETAEGAEEELELEDMLSDLEEDTPEEAPLEMPPPEPPKPPAAPKIPPEPEQAKEPDQGDLSTQLLMKIADELASIKSELSTFREKLQNIENGPPQEKKAPEPPGKEVEKVEKENFLEEEGESALTGDELEHILQSADFVQEAGADAGEPAGDFTVESVIGPAEGAGDEKPAEDVFATLDLPADEDFISLDVAGDDASLSLDSSSSSIEEDDLSYLDEEAPAEEKAEEEDLEELEPLEEEAEPAAGELVPEPEKTAGEDELLLDMPDFDESVLKGLPEEEEDLAFELGAPEEAAEAEEPAQEKAPVEQTAPESSSVTTGENDEKNEKDEKNPADSIPSKMKGELKAVLSYMDRLLESLPEEKIEEFAQSEYFETYKKLFEELGLA